MQLNQNLQMKEIKNFRSLHSKDSVEIEYELLKVTGKSKKDWIEAFDFKTFDKNLKKLKKSSKSVSETGEEKTDKSELNRQSKIYEYIKDDKPIYLLNIIDKNTLGLDVQTTWCKQNVIKNLVVFLDLQNFRQKLWWRFLC